MRINRRHFMRMAGLGMPMAAFGANALFARAWAAEAVPDEIPLPGEEFHVLNRTSFGASAQSMKDVLADGVDEFIRKQIYQDLPEDPEMDANLRRQYPEAYLTRKAMVEFYLGKEPGVPVGMPKQLKPHTSDLENDYRKLRDAAMGAGGAAVGAAGMLLPDEAEKFYKDLSRTRNPGHALTALREMTLYRAYRSPHQLYEVMVEFWGNHFSIDASSHRTLYVHKLLDDREVIRPHAMGTFRELLLASAKSTAMLYYLDGVSNVKGAANENYARELMELHTMGVGHYSHDDVLAVARCFTGWTIDPDTADFTYDDNKHDKDEKIVMGQTIPDGGGMEDGLIVLDMLMRSPATANRVATKLVRRFVSDEPDPDLVQRVQTAFGEDGDIKGMLETILYSPEFRAARDEKVKRPIHFMISALRATGAGIEVNKLSTLVAYLKPLEQLPYNWPTPDGYPDRSSFWVSTNALLHRWKYARLIGNGGGRNIDVNFDALLEGANTPRGIVSALSRNVLRRELSAQDEQTLVNHAAEDDDPDQVVGGITRRTMNVLALMLDSIYFQLR